MTDTISHSTSAGTCAGQPLQWLMGEEPSQSANDSKLLPQAVVLEVRTAQIEKWALA